MGYPDTITKEYMKNTNVFADLFNFFLYNGRPVIDPDKLHELDTTLTALPYGIGTAALPVQKFRDELKYLSCKQDETAAYLLLGIENESKINYAMPVKNMLYDSLQYSDQITQAGKSYRRKSTKPQMKKDSRALDIIFPETAAALELQKIKLSPDEFLSGFSKEDRLVPVVTLVLQFDNRPWDGAMRLHDMLAVQDPFLLSFIPDYHINLISPAALEDESFSMLQSSLREVLSYIKYSGDKKKLQELLHANERFHRMDRIAAEVINSVTHSHLNFDSKEEEIDMCKAIDDIRAEAIDIGKQQGIDIGKLQGIDIGRQQGIDIGKQQGIDIGKQQGIDIGKQQGIDIGKQQGIDIGRQQGAVQIIRFIMQQNPNFTVREAMSLIGISPAEYQKYEELLIFGISS